MPDPLEEPAIGDVSPYLNNFSTVRTTLEMMRNQRRAAGLPRNGGAVPAVDALPPATRCWVRNDTGADLNVLSVVKLGDTTLDLLDPDTKLVGLRDPVFKGTVPAATSDPFAVLTDAIPKASTGGTGSFGRAVTLGAVLADVNVTDAAHAYATPTAGDSSKLTSAGSGPARILYKPTGTGTKRCAVLLLGAPSASAITSGQTTYAGNYAVAADATWEDTGFSLALPAAGTYLVGVRFSAYAAVSSAATMGSLASRLYNVTAGAAVAGTETIAVSTVNNITAFYHHAAVQLLNVVTVAAASMLRIELYRQAGPTWSGTGIAGTTGFTGTSDPMTVMNYLKIG